MFFSIFAALIAVAIPFFETSVRRSRALAWSIGLVLLVHQVTSILQVALDGLPTMKMDPLSFNDFAMHGEGRLENNSYAQFLHLLYTIFGPSHFLGCQVSNIFFSLSLLVQMRLLVLLGYSKTLPKLILVFGLLPSCVLNTSVTLREAAQMFCYLAIALLLVSVCREGVKPSTLLLIPASIAMINLHQGMAALLIAVIPLSLAFALQARPAVLIALCLVAASGGVLVKDKILDTLKDRSAVLHSLSEGKTDYLEQYAKNVGESRSSFRVSLDLSSPGSALKTGPLLFTYYLFSPLPWQIRGLLDIYGLFESVLRMLLFYFALQTLRKSSGPARREQLLLGLLFFSVEIGWAIGTANWGTAFRHRLVAWGLLVALGGALFGAPSPTEVNPRPSSQKLSVRGRRKALLAKKESV